MRPKQWVKNILLFAGYIFTIEMPHPKGSALRVLAAFLLFCLISGCVYILNDSADAERDRCHPKKKNRPIASGQIPVKLAVPLAIVMAGVGIFAALRLDFWFGVTAGGYFLLTCAYSMSLKHMVIVDVLTIAAGFVIRAVAGAVVLFAWQDGVLKRVEISPWLLLCTTLLALFLGLAKRRHELVSLENGGEHRKILEDYSLEMIDQMLNISAATAVMAYSLYTFASFSKTGSEHPYMMVTIPFVIYGIFRYLYLIHTKKIEGSPEPEYVLLSDRPMILCALLWAATAMCVLKFG